MSTSAVNEFLAQMNNCGADDIFIIGATNRPTSIDPAIMRSGRLDKHIYISHQILMQENLCLKSILKIDLLI